MAETPDLDELARRYLDLWQQHLADLANDGEVAEAVAKSIELMTGSAAAFAAMAERYSKEPKESNHGQGYPGDLSQSSGTKTAGAALEHPDVDLDQLTRRIAKLERRIAELESGSGKRSK